MNWQDEGYLLNKRKFRENANIIDIFTSNYGKMSGIVYGGNSRKIRNFLQISNKIFAFYTAKNQNKIGYLKVELINPISPRYFNDKKRTTALIALTSILKILLPESQPYSNIYKSLENFLENMNSENWISLYVIWELNLIKELGFDPNLIQFFDKKSDLLTFKDIIIDGINYAAPNYLINNNLPKTYDNKFLKKSLTFTRTILMNKFFTPNNLIFPKSRILLENYFS
jgi:DNA repair protein RecO (recombination protein O)